MAQLKGPLSYFGTFYTSIQSALIGAERMLELFKTQPTVRDSPHAVTMAECNGEIDFKCVSFAYDERKPVLKNVTFNCKPGTTTALVGQSGAGKSTIIHLLFRFFEAGEGEICVDGKDVRNFKIESLRSNISVVQQDAHLFNATIMYNLQYANRNATDEDVIKACKDAGIHDTILEYKDG
jgi:ABC-type multidrug transport system fused ATPase/permease subunit